MPPLGEYMEKEFITPIEFINQKMNERLGDDIVAWFEDKPIDHIKMFKHDCELHFYAYSGDYTLVARNIGHYESCIWIEKIDYSTWRERLHKKIDELDDDELYCELIGGY